MTSIELHPNHFIGALFAKRYYLTSVIAHSTTSILYGGYDTYRDRIIAIKIFADSPSEYSFSPHHFCLTAHQYIQCPHPHLITVYDSGFYHNYPFIIMEYLSGGHARDLLHQRGPMPAYAAVSLLIPVLQGLIFLHQHHIIHGQIRPNNLMITHIGHIKINHCHRTNFFPQEITPFTSHNSNDPYLSPEQIAGSPPTIYSDLYALGITTYQLLTNSLPSHMVLADQTHFSSQQHRLIPSQQIPGIPQEFDQFVQRATYPNPTYRYQDGQTMLDELLTISHTLHLPSYQLPIPTHTTHKTQCEPDINATYQPTTYLPTIPLNNSTQNLPQHITTDHHHLIDSSHPTLYEDDHYHVLQQHHRYWNWIWILIIFILTMLTSSSGWILGNHISTLLQDIMIKFINIK